MRRISSKIFMKSIKTNLYSYNLNLKMACLHKILSKMQKLKINHQPNLLRVKVNKKF